MRATGSVKFFDGVRGFGFIVPDDGSAEVFVHRTDLMPNQPWAVGDSGIIILPGQKISYDLVDSQKGTGKKAAKVELVK